MLLEISPTLAQFLTFIGAIFLVFVTTFANEKARELSIRKENREKQLSIVIGKIQSLSDWGYILCESKVRMQHAKASLRFMQSAWADFSHAEKYKEELRNRTFDNFDRQQKHFWETRYKYNEARGELISALVHFDVYFAGDLDYIALKDKMFTDDYKPVDRYKEVKTSDQLKNLSEDEDDYILKSDRANPFYVNSTNLEKYLISKVKYWPDEFEIK